MKSNTISIVGSGWLAKPLANTLTKSGGEVMLTSRSEEKVKELNNDGFKAIKLSLEDLSSVSAEFWKSDIFIVTITPTDEELIRNLVKKLEDSAPQHVIITSSTSVYPNKNKEVVEEDAIHIKSKHSGRDLLAIEKIYSSLPHTILRFGGLFGGVRHPGKFLLGKRPVSSSEAPVNMTHLSDAIGASVFLSNSSRPLGVLNVVSPEHPSKREFYTAAATKIGVEKPTFFNSLSDYKVVSSQRLIDLGYLFKVVNPIEAL